MMMHMHDVQCLIKLKTDIDSVLPNTLQFRYHVSLAILFAMMVFHGDKGNPLTQKMENKTWKPTGTE